MAVRRIPAAMMRWRRRQSGGAQKTIDMHAAAWPPLSKNWNRASAARPGIRPDAQRRATVRATPGWSRLVCL